MSRIFYQGKFYDYPLKATNALRNLGFIEAVRCVLSYIWARIRPPKDQSNLEGWVVARFGRRLYSHFFKTYNEKLWGVPATEIQADWAAQRIKNLSLFKAIVNMFDPRKNQTKVTSLIEQFEYPKYGPGMMWEVCAEKVEAAGTPVLLETPVVGIRHADGRATAVLAGRDGEPTEYPADHIVSSMPISSLLKAMDPPPPPEVLAAADDIRYRDFLTVALVVPEEVGFPDNWIYIHAPDVEVGRIQNYGQWSPYMVKDGRTCLGMEYFVSVGDEVWDASDDELVELATREIDKIGLVRPDQVEKGYVVRMPKTYPMYDEHYQANVTALREWIEQNTPNVHPVGRNGMHRYNNQDHSMFTAMLSVDNMFGGHHDVWSVNVEEEYHEEVYDDRDDAGKATRSPSGTGRDAPIIPRRALEGARNRP